MNNVILIYHQEEKVECEIAESHATTDWASKRGHPGEIIQEVVQFPDLISQEDPQFMTGQSDNDNNTLHGMDKELSGMKTENMTNGVQTYNQIEKLKSENMIIKKAKDSSNLTLSNHSFGLGHPRCY